MLYLICCILTKAFLLFCVVFSSCLSFCLSFFICRKMHISKAWESALLNCSGNGGVKKHASLGFFHIKR